MKVSLAIHHRCREHSTDPMTLSSKERFAASTVIPALVGLAGTYFAANIFDSYGWALFLGLPVLVSFLSAFILRRTGSTTWYRQTISPDFYWHRISDHLIHLIHLRVLEHIRNRAEQRG